MGRRFKKDEAYENRFYRIPKAFFKTEKYKGMSLESKVLYGFLDDRRGLSIKNNWVDEENNIYLIFSRKEVQEMLCLSDKPVTRAFKELKAYDLIEEVRQGINKPNLIYVCHLDLENIENMRIRIISDSRSAENTIQDAVDIRGNDTDLNKTNINDTEKKKGGTLEGTSNEDTCQFSYDRYLEYINNLLKTINTSYRQDIYEAIMCYYGKYHETFGTEHIRYTKRYLIEIITRLDTIFHIGILDEQRNDTVSIDIEEFKILTDKHFATVYKKAKYTLLSFLNDKILINRYYEELL